MTPDEFIIPHLEIKMVKNRYFAVILHQPHFRYVLWEENLILYSVNLHQTLLRTMGPDQFKSCYRHQFILSGRRIYCKHSVKLCWWLVLLTKEHCGGDRKVVVMGWWLDWMMFLVLSNFNDSMLELVTPGEINLPSLLLLVSCISQWQSGLGTSRGPCQLKPFCNSVCFVLFLGGMLLAAISCIKALVWSWPWPGSQSHSFTFLHTIPLPSPFPLTFSLISELQCSSSARHQPVVMNNTRQEAFLPMSPHAWHPCDMKKSKREEMFSTAMVKA